MRELTVHEVNGVSGAYGNNIIINIVEGATCSIMGGVVGSWVMATLGGRGAFSGDLVGIGGGLTALIGMIGGAAVGAVAGAVIGPYAGYNNSLEIGKDLLRDLMKGMPGS